MFQAAVAPASDAAAVIAVPRVGAWLIDETLLHAGFHTFLVLAAILFIQLGGGGVSR